MDTHTDTQIADERGRVKPAAQAVTAVWPGRSYPRGAHWDGEGVNFALFSEHAEKVELCLQSYSEMDYRPPTLTRDAATALRGM